MEPVEQRRPIHVVGRIDEAVNDVGAFGVGVHVLHDTGTHVHVVVQADHDVSVELGEAGMAGRSGTLVGLHQQSDRKPGLYLAQSRRAVRIPLDR